MSEEDEAAELEEEKEGAAAAKQAKHQPKQPSKVGRCCQLHTYVHRRTDTHTHTHAYIRSMKSSWVTIPPLHGLHWTTAQSAHVLTYLHILYVGALLHSTVCVVLCYTIPS